MHYRQLNSYLPPEPLREGVTKTVLEAASPHDLVHLHAPIPILSELLSSRDSYLRQSFKLGCGNSTFASSSSPKRARDKNGGPMQLNVPQMGPPGGGGGGGLRVPPSSNGSLPTIQTASATGNPRNKVSLKPGHSLMDWIRLGRSKDLAGTGGRVIPVPMEELAKHNKPENSWTAIKGKVYNITPYMDFHPGGVDELMRSAGIDGTELFDEVHKWVNFESMLEKCYIGPLASDSPRKVKQKVIMRPSSSSLTVGGLGNLAPPSGKPSPRYEWLQTDATVSLVIYTKCKSIRSESVIIDKTGPSILVTAMVEDYTYTVAIELEAEIEAIFNVKASRASGKVEIILKKSDPNKRWTNLGKPLPLNNKWTKASERDKSYRAFRVATVEPVTHDTKLFGLEPPAGCYFRVPIGHHVYIKEEIDGMVVSKPYTAVPNSLLEDELDPSLKSGGIIYLMIKCYPDGSLTSILDKVKAGDSLQISDHEGAFDLSVLEDCDNLVMCAAGTGFTPMVGLLLHSLVHSPKDSRKVQLYFFNKETKDILWKDKIDALVETSNGCMTTVNILSQPDESWNGLTGRIRGELLKDKIPSPSNQVLFCACGPTAFTNEAIRLAKEEFKYTEKTLHAFLG